MENVILVLHYIVSIGLVLVILLQAGKGADMGAVFGGGSSTVFGSRGAATFLSKLTTGMALVFLMTSLTMAYFSKNQSESSILKSGSEASAPAVESSGEASPSVEKNAVIPNQEKSNHESDKAASGDSESQGDSEIQIGGEAPKVSGEAAQEKPEEPQVEAPANTQGSDSQN